MQGYAGLSRLQKGGAPQAQYELAHAHRKGAYGLTKSNATALVWLIRSAESGNRRAMEDVASMLSGGEEMQPDYAEAAKWYQVLAEQDNPVAQFSLALLYEDGRGVPQSYERAKRLYEEPRRQGFLLLR
jgi:TPR repeat protein